MREAMLKPMILLAAALLILGGVFAWWIASSGPATAVGARAVIRAEQQRQVDKIIREIDN